MAISNFTLYLIGAAVLTSGLVLMAYKLGVPLIWTGLGFIVMIGIGIMSAVSKTRQKEKSNTGSK